MRLSELAGKVGAKVLTAETPAGREVGRVYAGDRISDILNHASDATLLVTSLATTQLARVAELMDLPAICLVGGQVPEPEVIAAATRHGTAILVSPFGMFETCGRLYEWLKPGHG